MPGNFEILAKAAAGDPAAEAAAAQILLNANRAFFRDGFNLPLQRYAGLPCTMSKLLKPQRDYWLRVAFNNCSGETQWHKCKFLAAELKRMETVFWPSWKQMADPPINASELRKSLFYALRLGISLPSTPQQLMNIVKFSEPEI